MGVAVNQFNCRRALCPRCKQTHQTAEEVKTCLTEWQRTRGVTPFKELLARSSLGTPGAVALRKTADPKLVKRVLDRVDELEAKQRKVIDKGARGLDTLEIVSGIHSITEKPGFFVFARAIIGNFPVCWRPTEQEARKYGEQFMLDVVKARENKRSFK
jgi:hypothetical protein